MSEEKKPRILVSASECRRIATMNPGAMTDRYMELRRAYDSLLAERDRLKAALEKIATGRTNEFCEPDKTYDIAGYIAQEIAREALKQPTQV